MRYLRVRGLQLSSIRGWQHSKQRLWLRHGCFGWTGTSSICGYDRQGIVSLLSWLWSWEDVWGVLSRFFPFLLPYLVCLYKCGVRIMRLSHMLFINCYILLITRFTNAIQITLKLTPPWLSHESLRIQGKQGYHSY